LKEIFVRDTGVSASLRVNCSLFKFAEKYYSIFKLLRWITEIIEKISGECEFGTCRKPGLINISEAGRDWRVWWTGRRGRDLVKNKYRKFE